MNRMEHLFTILGEECAEVAQRASKITRFGVNEVQPGQTEDNARRLLGEWADLNGVMEMLEYERHIPMMDIEEFQKLKKDKKEKVEKFLKYSAEQGTLTEVAK